MRVSDYYGEEIKAVSETNRGQTVTMKDLTRYTDIYDIENRLVRVEDNAGSVVAEYYYDPFGRRLWKEVGGSRTYYFYSDEGLIGEYDSGGNEMKTYGYTPGSKWGTILLFQKIGSTYYWYINDHLGTPQIIIDITGRVVWAATYDSFGKATITTEEITNNLRFPGQYFDAESDLHYNWNRYYNPSIGRYISDDPIRYAGGDINLYAYVKNNPVNFTDPRGWDRYEICEDQGYFQKWACEKAVDKSCGFSQQSEAYCCDVDLKCCLKDIDVGDPEYEEKAKKCRDDHWKCVRGIK